MPKKRATKKRGGEKPPLTEEEKMFARKGVQYTQVRSAKPGKQQLSDEAFKKEIKQNDEEAKIAKINAQLAKKPRIPKRKEGPEKENLPTKRQRTGEPAEKADEPPAKKADEPPKKVKNMDEFMKKLGTVSGETVMKQPKKEGKQDRPDPHEKEKKVAPKNVEAVIEEIPVPKKVKPNTPKKYRHPSPPKMIKDIEPSEKKEEEVKEPPKSAKSSSGPAKSREWYEEQIALLKKTIANNKTDLANFSQKKIGNKSYLDKKKLIEDEEALLESRQEYLASMPSGSGKRKKGGGFEQFIPFIPQAIDSLLRLFGKGAGSMLRKRKTISR